MELDDETRELLGHRGQWSELTRDQARGERLRVAGGRVNGSRIAPGDIDGRHKRRDREALKRAHQERRKQKEKP